MPNRAAEWRTKVTAEHRVKIAAEQGTKAAADYGPEVPVVERTRNGIKFDIGNGQHRLITSIGPMHTLKGEEIDTDLEPGQGAFHSRTKAGKLDFVAQFRAGGGRILTPREDHPLETVELGVCETLNKPGNQWIPMPPVLPVRSAHRLDFDHGPLGRIRISVKGTFVAYEIIVGSADQNSGWRWPVTLTGLTWVQDSPEQARLVATSDGETAMWVSAPKWTDSSEGMPKSGPVGWSYTGGNLVHDAAVLPADVVYPVVVR